METGLLIHAKLHDTLVMNKTKGRNRRVTFLVKASISLSSRMCLLLLTLSTNVRHLKGMYCGGIHSLLGLSFVFETQDASRMCSLLIKFCAVTLYYPRRMS